MRIFSELEQVHRHLEEVFLRHQEALIRLDPRAALSELELYRRQLEAHIALEEESLIPLYQERGGDEIAGGRVRFYLSEHRKILKSLRAIRKACAALVAAPTAVGPRDVLPVLEREFSFKHLMAHHDDREHSFLYPHLDRVTNALEKKDLLAG